MSNRPEPLSAAEQADMRPVTEADVHLKRCARGWSVTMADPDGKPHSFEFARRQDWERALCVLTDKLGCTHLYRPGR